MGAVAQCCSMPYWARRRRYQRLDENVVIEFDDEETKGYYYFKDMPKLPSINQKPTPIVTDAGKPYKEIVRVHRFSSLVESKTLASLEVKPCAPEWRVVHKIKDMDFTICKPNLVPLLSSGYLCACMLTSPTNPPGHQRGVKSEEQSRVATMRAPCLYAEEIARAFWDPNVDMKKSWDPTLESFENVERLSDMAFVAHIVFKTMWPASQRDAVLCSEMTPLSNDGWLVCNQSVVHPRCEEKQNIIRMACDVTLVVRQSFVDPVSMHALTLNGSDIYPKLIHAINRRRERRGATL